MGPLLFEPYAGVVAARVAQSSVGRVLETAAGTGILTRALIEVLPADVEIIATDLNQPMLDHAASRTQGGRVTWRLADAQSLSMGDGSFDAVACQFGVMFFTDRQRSYGEAWRVLVPGGRFIVSVWDGIEHNEFADVVTSAMAEVFPEDPPRFLERTPHGYHDPSVIRREFAQAGFDDVALECVAKRSVAGTAREVAVAFCQGTPLRNEIEARDSNRLGEATVRVEAAIARRFGNGPVSGKMQARIVTATRW